MRFSSRFSVFRRYLTSTTAPVVPRNPNQSEYIKDVLESNRNFWKPNAEVKNIVVEFSSPNIAKPFHIGHLRSTIVGNFVANLFEKYAKCNVTRLNYLGDWGIQFGLLKIGMDLLRNNHPELSNTNFDKTNPIKSLYESYVLSNKLAEKDATILEEAKKIFQEMEHGSNDVILKEWQDFQKITIDYLETTYRRLGVEFDQYDFESFYSSNRISDLIDQLKSILVDQQKINVNNKDVIILKSDGTSLYITRDVAAAIDRYQRYQFDQMFYVVSDQQLFHFQSLFHLLKIMDFEWTDRLAHLQFGQVSGMSTRKGNAVFLSDILDEMSERMYQKQLVTETTKISNSDKKTADILAVSCMIIHDLKHRRKKHYDFDWDKALNVHGDSGIRLQYTHCRLSSILRNSSLKPATNAQPEFFVNSPHYREIIALVDCMAQYPDILEKCYQNLEAYPLVRHMFQLCNKLNVVIKKLQVKELENEDASQALLLFETSRFILKNGMEILGLQVLTKM